MGVWKNIKDLLNWYRHNEDAKECTIYFIFVIIFSIIAFNSNPGEISYNVNGYARDALGLEDGDSGVQSVSSVASLDEWISNELPQLLFPQETYDGRPMDAIQRLYLVGEGRGMGAVRLRNVRAPFTPCNTPRWLTEVNGKVVNCTAGIGIGNYMVDSYGERDSFEPGNLPDGINFTKPFDFQTRGELNTTFFADLGNYGTYPQDGFNLDIIPNVAPNVLADKIQQCRPLLEASILQCMRNQTVEFDPPASPPPPVVVVPQPPPLQLGSGDAAGMVLSSESGGQSSFIMELEQEFILGEEEGLTGEYRFRIHNPQGGVGLQWEFDQETRDLLASTSWIAENPTMLQGVVDAATAVLDPQSLTTGTDIVVKVKTGDTYARLPAGQMPRIAKADPEKLVLKIVSPQNPALITTVTLVMNYKLTALGDAPTVGAPSGASAPAPAPAPAPGRKMLQQASAPAPAPSTPTVEQLLEDNSKAPAAAKCDEAKGAIDLVNLPSKLNISRCALIKDKLRECEFPYLGFHQLLELSRPDRCGECKCKSDVNSECLKSCSAKTIFEEQYTMLKKWAWFDRRTRGVIIDMSVLHQNINLFQTIRILYEFPTFGGVSPAVRIKTFKLYRYVTNADNIVLGLEIVFCMMLLWYTIEELLEIRKSRAEYFTNAWNILDWINLIIFYVVISLRVGSFIYTDGFDYNSVTVEYIDFMPIGVAIVSELNVLAINFFLMYFKVFKYLSKVPRMDSILLTVSSCSFDLVLFFVMFSIIMFGFDAAFFIVFGPYLSDYKSLSTCFGTLFRILLGDFDYQSLDEINATMAPILFYSFIVMGFMLLMNMLLAIVCDSFADVKGNQSEEDLNFYINLRDKLAARAKALFTKNQELNALSQGLKMADSNMDNLIDESELEEALKHNPRAYELLQTAGAKELLKKYDVDGNGVLDPSEMTAILKEIAEKEAEINAEIKETEEDAKEAAGKMSSQFDGAFGGGVAQVDLTEVEQRLDKVEGQIKEMSRNVAKKLALMIDLMMSLSDQISNVNANPGGAPMSGIVPVSHSQGGS